MSKDESKNNPEENEPHDGHSQTISTGDHLQRLRIEHGWHIEDVSEATKISTSNIRAIENSDYTRLPADTFTRGLLIIYAQHLGADVERTVSRFFEERDASRSDGKRSRPKKTGQILTPKTLAEPAHFSSAAVAGIILVIILILFTTYCFYMSWNPFSQLASRSNPLQAMMKTVLPTKEATLSIIPPSSSEPTHAALNPTGTKSPQAAEQNNPAGGSGTDGAGQSQEHETSPPVPLHTLNVVFLQDTEVESIIDELSMTKKTFKKGDQFEWNAQHSMTVIFKTPDSAELRLNGQAISFPKPENDQLILRIPEAVLDM